MSLKQNKIHSKNDSRKLNQLKTSYATNLTNKKTNSKITQENKDLREANNPINKMIKRMDDNLEIEKTKRNALEQYDRWEILEVTGIPNGDGEDCIDIIYNLRVNINKYKEIKN